MKYFLKKLMNIFIFNSLKLFRVFKIRKKNIIFLSFDGKQISGSPLYIFEYISERYKNEYTINWVLQKSKIITNQRKDINIIEKDSLKFYFKILTSKYIITNDRINSFIPVRAKQVLVNTWHGGGLFKKTYPISLDKKRYNYIKWLNHRDSKRTTLYLSSSQKWTENVLRSTFDYKGQVCNSGLPRNTIFFNKKNKKIKEKLNIPVNDGIILFAPTFRTNLNNSHENLKIENCINLWEKKESKKFHFLYRGHHMVNKSSLTGSFVDVSNYPDMQELLSISDVFISDFSSSLWDFSLTKRPSFIFAPDIKDFDKKNGFESNYKSWPFDIANSNSELILNMTNYNQSEYTDKISKYHRDLTSYENYESTKKAVNLILSL
jgi:CDP-glycerol glycerophosphotransferase